MQSAFRKCRQEGDLRKRNGGPSEMTYSMMDENGDMDNGVVTPADMLSFARQVAMAMVSTLSDYKSVELLFMK